MRKVVILVVATAFCACGSSSSGGGKRAAAPTFTPIPGTYTTAQNVTISSTTPGATIHFTTDGTTPTDSSPTYSAAVQVSSSTTIMAIAAASGFTDSTVATGAYNINPNAQPTATPTFSPAGGTFTSTQTVTISSTTPNSTIYYTTNGTTPTTSSTLYTGPVSVSSTETINAIAIASGFTVSDVGTAAYTISSGGGGGSFSTYCTEVQTALTSTLTTCFNANSAVFSDPKNQLLKDTCTREQNDINANRIIFNSSFASACVSEYSAETCAQITEGVVPADCKSALVGNVQNGQGCYSGDDCANGFCDETGGCPGTCTAYAASGGSCASANCAPGLSCNSSQVCVTPSAAGGNCPCAAGLWCDTSNTSGGANPAGTCTNPVATGAACTSGDQCMAGNVCASGTNTCLAFVGNGGNCAASPTDLCGYGYECVSGTCQSWPSAGAACSESSPLCIGSFCPFLATSPVCTAYVADGGTCNPCYAGGDCSSGSCLGTCNSANLAGSTGTCQPTSVCGG